MKKVEIELFQFDELEQEAQDKLIEEYEFYDESEFNYDEAEKTVEKFLDLFPRLKTGTRSWLDPYTHSMEDNILQLEGLRLRTWLINNVWPKIYKPKFIHKGAIGINTKSRYSKVQLESCCPLTGVCWDNDILEPIHKTIKWKGGYRHLSMEDIIERCFNNLKKSLESATEYCQSKEYISERLRNDNKWYTSQGIEINL